MTSLRRPIRARQIGFRCQRLIVADGGGEFFYCCRIGVFGGKPCGSFGVVAAFTGDDLFSASSIRPSEAAAAMVPQNHAAVCFGEQSGRARTRLAARLPSACFLPVLITPDTPDKPKAATEPTLTSDLAVFFISMDASPPTKAPPPKELSGLSETDFAAFWNGSQDLIEQVVVSYVIPSWVVGLGLK